MVILFHICSKTWQSTMKFLLTQPLHPHLEYFNQRCLRVYWQQWLRMLDQQASVIYIARTLSTGCRSFNPVVSNPCTKVACSKSMRVSGGLAATAPQWSHHHYKRVFLWHLRGGCSVTSRGDGGQRPPLRQQLVDALMPHFQNCNYSGVLLFVLL